jgi:hypothetical protein
MRFKSKLIKVLGVSYLPAFIIVILVAILKLIFQYYELELLSVNPLLTAIISGNIFILGFLLNSTMRDFKEAEKFPGEFSTYLETIYDECEIMYLKHKNISALACIRQLQVINKKFENWFYKKAYTQDVLMEISNLNKYWEQFEDVTQANFIVRMKNEQNNMRRALIRVNTLRDTPFYEASYKIAKFSVIMMIVMLLFIKSNPFYEYLFYVLAITFLNIFLVNLIKDLDDPFEYNGHDISDEVSLKPLSDFGKRLNLRLQEFKIDLKK